MTDPAFSTHQLEHISARFERQPFKPHVHEGFCIAVIEQGAQRFQREGCQHVAAQGQLLLINADQLHDGQSADPASGCRYHAIYPHPELLQPIIDDMSGPAAGLPWFDAVVDDPQLSQHLQQLFQALQSDALPLQQDTLYLSAMTLLIQRHSRNTGTLNTLHNAPAKVQRVRDYLDAYCCQPITLAELAALVELNPNYLTRLFTQHIGLAPQYYQLMRRIDHAKQLLQKGHPLALTAVECGFGDQAHFTHHFRRFTGLTPGRYQQLMRT